MKSKETPKSHLSPTLEADKLAAELELQKEDAKTALRRYKSLLKRAAVEERVVANFRDITEETLADKKWTINIPQVIVKKEKNLSSEEAVLVISDSHVWKIVKKGHTLGFGHYNPKVFLDRLFHLEQTVIKLLKVNIVHPITKLHVLLLGDLVEGMLNHSQELPTRGFVVDQVHLATLAFFQFIARLSRIVPVECRGVVGNHGRWGTQKKMPTEGRFSNFDFIAMSQIQSLMDLTGLNNAKFLLDEAPFQVFDILGWRFKIGHGDHLKGGDKAFGIPAHSIGREVNATTQRYASIGQRPPDFYIIGDKHRHISLPTARGRYLVNGAWFDCDDYAMAANFSPNRPFQMFFGVHQRIGKTWSYDIQLDLAEPVPVQYQLPERLSIKLEEYV